MLMSALLEVEDLAKYFPMKRLGGAGHVVRAVDGVSLTIDAGKTLGLIGESGCGKSTLGRCIMRVIEPSKGAIRVGGVDLAALSPANLRAMRQKVQMVFQDSSAALNPRMTVRRMVEEPLLLHAKLGRAERRDRIEQVLEQVGLGIDLADRYPHELSGGQRQRANIARAIVARPRLVVLDEPTSALDVSLRSRIILLLERLREELDLAYLFISHDIATVKYLSEQIAVMYLGVIVEQGSAAEIIGDPRHPYTRALVSAVPIPDPDKRQDRFVLRGELPDAATAVRGCRLLGRCPLAASVCTEAVPIREVSPGHYVACHMV
jgi:oligopeptide/dipeptide ABC transporter ATP-binding protein